MTEKQEAKIYQETRKVGDHVIHFAVFHEVNGARPDGMPIRATLFYFWGWLNNANFEDAPHYWTHALEGHIDPYNRPEMVDEMYHCAHTRWDLAARRIPT